MNKKTLKETLLREIERLTKKGIKITNIEFVCECENHYELVRDINARALMPVSDIIIDITRLAEGETAVEKLKTERKKELEQTLDKVVDYAQRYEINKFKIITIPLTTSVIDEPINYVKFMIMFNYKNH